MTLQKPSPSELVFDGQTIWHAQELGADLGGGWQVAKAKDAKSLQSNGFLRLLFGDKNVFQELKLISREERSPEILAFKFEPLPGKDFASINRFVIEMNRPRMTLTKIDYTDENGNRIVYDFLSFRRRADLTKSDFSFKPPAGARVTEYQ
jgi:outer membrane lipoprotein-sorting protein